ncbi:MAG: hypothetical protein J6Q61_01915 [Bacteroidales bacterium]|nr:hypothetical protein [Bacteroidales bacterium]
MRRKLEAETEAEARKDIAESPTAEPERPKKKKTTSQQDYMTTSCWGDVVFTEKTIS